MDYSDDVLVNTYLYWPRSVWQDLDGNLVLVHHLDRNCYYYEDAFKEHYLREEHPKNRGLIYVTKL
jgi:hypothetical protein